MATPVPVITGIVESGVADDFSSVQVSFGVDDGEPVVCRILPETLQRVIIHLSEMAAYIRNQTLTKGEPHSVPAVLAIDAKAHSSVDGGKVILAVRAGNNVVQHFALAPKIAARLRSQLPASEAPEKQQSDRTQ
jgi:hypothetical protein